MTKPAKVGRTDTVDGEIIPCQHGLHASPTPWDALAYACGDTLWEVELSGTVVAHGNPTDKHAASERKYLRKADVGLALRQFACRQALGVIHLWDAPAIVREYLESVVSGCERKDMRAAAGAAACDVAWAAAGAAACDAARAAAWDVAWAAAGTAAWAAARATAGTAAWTAAWTATKKQFNETMIKALNRQEQSR